VVLIEVGCQISTVSSGAAIINDTIEYLKLCSMIKITAFRIAQDTQLKKHQNIHNLAVGMCMLFSTTLVNFP
jgi:hypothetical protein